MPVIFTATNLDTRADMDHDEANNLVGNGILAAGIIIDSGQVNNYFARQSPSNVGDTFTQSFMIRAGTYTFSVLGQQNSVNGKIDWYLDGVSFVTGQDWYNAAQQKNVVVTASLTILTDGYHVLKGVVNSKNASSSGYNADLTKYWLRQAAD